MPFSRSYSSGTPELSDFKKKLHNRRQRPCPIWPHMQTFLNQLAQMAVSAHAPIFRVFTARYCYGKLSVRPSVCPYVTSRYRDQIVWNSSKIISRLVSLECSLSADPNITDLLQGERPEILAGMGDSIEKAAFGIQQL